MTLKITKNSARTTVIDLCGSAIGYLVRNKRGPRDTPPLVNQHADCVLSTGEPVGFFGRGGVGSGGSMSASWNSMEMNKIAGALGYDQMLAERPCFVNEIEAQKLRLYSTLLIFTLEASLTQKLAEFDAWWWEQKLAEKGSRPPFHLVGRNCSTFASQSFQETDIFRNRFPRPLETPNKLFKALVASNSNRYKLRCFSGFVGFKPNVDLRRLRVNNKNVKYDILISECEEHRL